MKARLRFVYTRAAPGYTPEETAKLDAARIQVFGNDPDGLYGFCGSPGVIGCQGEGPMSPKEQAEAERSHQEAWDRAERHNTELQRKLDSVYEIAGVPERTLEQVTHYVEVELPDFPSYCHHIMSAVEMYGVDGPYDGKLLDRVNQ